MEEQGDRSRSAFSEQKTVSKFEEFLFEKTLTGIDCEDFFDVSTEHALAHFPSLCTRKKAGDFSKIETLNILHLQSLGNACRMDFVYSFANKSYGISTGWNKFVTKYNLKQGDVIEFYKSTYPLHPNLYYIDCHVDGKKTTKETENTAKPVEMKTIKMYDLDLNYLFEKELTLSDVSWLCYLQIPTQEAKMHFPPLMNPEVRMYFKEKKLLILDPKRAAWKMEISLMLETNISEGWGEFVSFHKLQEKDLIRFFRILNNFWYDEWYFIDFVKANVDEMILEY